MRKLMIVLLTITMTFLLASCKSEEVIRIGFSGTLSGTYSSVGVSQLYGVQLAVKEINDAGGIDGKLIEIVIRDDEADPLKAVEVDNELFDMGIEIIIGHSLSVVAVEAVENANEKGFLLLSPSIGTDELSGVDDNLIRNVATVLTEGTFISNEIVNSNPSKILFVYNTDNLILNKYHLQALNTVVSDTSFPEEQVIKMPFGSENSSEIEAIEDELLTNTYDSLFIASSNNDAAIFVNYVVANDLDVQIHLTSWASTGILPLIDLVNTENITSYVNFDLNSQDAKYVEFKNNYENEFGTSVDMLSINGYDMMNVLIDAIESSGVVTAVGIKSAIIDMGTVSGINGDFLFNEFGDTLRDHKKQYIVDGEFIIVED